jgi:hypothetical protein
MALAGTGNCAAVGRHAEGLACHHDGRAGLTISSCRHVSGRETKAVGDRDNPPETKGKTLVKVQEMWADPAERHRAIHTWK